MDVAEPPPIVRESTPDDAGIPTTEAAGDAPAVASPIPPSRPVETPETTAASRGVDNCIVVPDSPQCQAQREIDIAADLATAKWQDRQLRYGGYDDDKRAYHVPALEVGLGPFVMAGGATGGYAGLTPFLVDEVTAGLFLRPALAVGQSLATHVPSVWAAGRLDVCTRLPGTYPRFNGIQLNLCGGPDIGFSHVSSGTLPGTPRTAETLPYVNLGPSVDLQGEIDRLSVSLRGVMGVDFARQGFVDVTGARVQEPLVAWRLELDFSWALRR
jgi:hypothetical protein